MKAAQLVAFKSPLQIRKIPIPSPRGEQVLVRIAGSGLCHSDLYIIEGRNPVVQELPFTLGHENAGFVESLGDHVKGLRKGDGVAVYGGWSDIPDRFSRAGNEQLTNISNWVGIGRPGGLAEYLLVPTYRYLVPLEGLDPVLAAPLTDAGLTPYRAVKKVLPVLYPNSTAVVIGIGGLGQYAVRYLALLSQANIVAVDIYDEKLTIARELGASVTINSKHQDPVTAIKELTNNEGAQAFLDFVGLDVTMNQSYSAAGRQARIVIVGLGGGTMQFSTYARWNEIEVTTSNWGNIAELVDVIELARRGSIKPNIQRIGFEQVNDAYNDLMNGKIMGRAVLLPNK